jgi:hypothetical protein
MALVLAGGCAQPPVACVVSTFTAYAATYQLVQSEGDPSCAELAGDSLGMAAYNPSQPDSALPDLSRVSMAIRSDHVGARVARAAAEGIVDEAEGHAPHAVGPFASSVPVDGICTPTLAPVAQALPALGSDLGDPEDPDDDVRAQAAMDVTEQWSDVQVYVTAKALGTQMKGRYVFTDAALGCSATYDVLAVFPAVPCDEVVADGEDLDIESIDDNADHLVEVTTAAPHGLAAGDAIEVAGVDDDARSYEGSYTVGTVTSPTSFVTEEVDPDDGDDPDPASDRGTVRKLRTVANEDLCSAVALPDKGLAFGSGISPDFPVVCDPALFLCVLDAEPSAPFPVLK